MERTGGRIPWCVVGLVALFVVVVSACAVTPSPQLEQRTSARPSDPRAKFVSGNVTTCPGAGFPGAIQVGAEGNSPANDANVSGTPKANAGLIQPGQGEEVDVAITGGAVIDGVIVKGGPAFNVYSNTTVLPPALAPDEHYISPLNGGGNVPDLSHWFVCYHLGSPPPVGSLIVLKAVSDGDVPATPLPTAFTVLVNCNDADPTHHNVTVNLPGGGGIGSPILTGIPLGTVCTVVEQGTGSFPPGTKVTYDPSGADTPGVTTGGTGPVIVNVTNDFSGVASKTGTLQIVKTLVPPGPGVVVPSNFVIEVLCDDGTEATVTVPGGGGPGTPTVTAKAGALCSLEETEAPTLPPGWVVTYSVNGGPAGSELPLATIVANQTVTVNIINDPTQVSPEVVTRPVVVQPNFTG
jgi:hypothetical protein